MPLTEPQGAFLGAEYNNLAPNHILPDRELYRAVVRRGNALFSTNDFTEQIVGRNFSVRRRRANGQGAVNRLSRAQTLVLQEAFDQNPYPYVGTRILLASQLNLTHYAVHNWFQNARRSRRVRIGRRNNSSHAYFMWFEYRRNPAAYVNLLLNGSIDLQSGRPTGIRAFQNIGPIQNVPAAQNSVVVQHIAGVQNTGTQDTGTQDTASQNNAQVSPVLQQNAPVVDRQASSEDAEFEWDDGFGP